MISSERKQQLVQLILEAAEARARIGMACNTVEISYRSFLRWKAGKLDDKRKGSSKTVPRKLTQEERDECYSLLNNPRFRDMTPAQIVATLLDEGTYYASERTMYRILHERNANIRRAETRVPRRRKAPPQLIAHGPNQVWTWDITWMKTDVRGVFLYGYVIIDIYSRKIVGWTIKNTEDPEHARDLFKNTIIRERAAPQFVHADNGGPMRGVTLRIFLNSLDVKLSYNRPRVSNDNPYSESWFGTMKTHVSFPKVFTSNTHAMDWLANFVSKYNTEHKHSGISYVTPQQRHLGHDQKILSYRQKIKNQAASRHPERFVCGPGYIAPEGPVQLNCRSSKVA